MIQKLRCTGIAHLRVEVDLFDLKATAMAPGLDDHIDEHSQKSADIIAREIAAALGFLDEQCQLLEGARRSASMAGGDRPRVPSSEEPTSELQSLMRIPYAVFCLQKNIHA